VSFHARKDLDGLFGNDAITNVGFAAYVELDAPSHHPSGWLLELRSTSGTAVEDQVRKPITTDLEQLWRWIRGPRVSRLGEDLFANQVLPTMTRLAVDERAGTVEEIVDYGGRSKAPDVSIVIATTAIDRIEHQLIGLAGDPDLARAELIYAIPRVDDDELPDLAASLSDLHRIAFRVVRVSATASRPRTVNLAASLARGRLLLLMGGDVLPVEHGWLSALLDFYDGQPGVGAVGPMLLHEDGSIANVGVQYARGRRPNSWRGTARLRGLGCTLEAAAHQRRVDAASDDCVLLNTERFRAQGGLCELYLSDRDLAGDLCLGLAEAELETWYFPGATLFLLERQTWPKRATDISSAYDDWLFNARRGIGLRSSHDERDGAVRALLADSEIERVAPADPGSPVQIVAVTRAELGAGLMLDGDLSSPSIGTPYAGTYSFVIDGWVLPRDGRAPTVEIRAGALPQHRVVADLPRPDIGARYPDMPGADTSGFRFVLGSLALPLEFEIEVDVVADEGNRERLGQIRGRRRRLRSTYVPRLEPLLVSTLGRSGSTWLCVLLSLHPGAIAYHPVDSEGALASYWLGALSILSQPASYMQTILPMRSHDDAWFIGLDRADPLPLRTTENEIPRWLGREHAESLATICQHQIDSFYVRLARFQDREPPPYFVEKCPPETARAILELYPNGREVVLVRDLRDQVCSILAYNAKRGFELWGRDITDTDEQWFQYLRGRTVDLLAAWHERRDRAHLLRYEDLIADPLSSLVGVFEYLGLDASAGTIRRILTSAVRTGEEAQRYQRTAPTVEASVGRWRHELSTEQKALCAECFDDVQAELGYTVTSLV
jgi:hypothetical protein